MASTLPGKNETAVLAGRRRLGLMAVVCLAGGVALVYWNSLHAPFLFDDAGAVVNNPTIRRLVSWDVLNPPADGSTTTGRPVVNLSYALNRAISGENVWSYHALNLAIHILASLTLFGLARRTLEMARRVTVPAAASCEGRVPNPPPLDSDPPDRRVQDNAPYLPDFAAADGHNKPAPLQSEALAFAIALIWAVHPLQTESVVCIAQRTESLCSLFYLLTLYCFVRGAQSGMSGCRSLLAGDERRASSEVACKQAPTFAHGESRHAWRWFSLSILASLLGMATKEVMATAPLIVLLYDRTFIASGFGAAWRQRHRYYVTLAGTWLLLAWLVFGIGGMRGASAGLGLGVSWWTYLLKQCEAVVLYLELSIWPHPLVLDYGTAVSHSIADVWWQGMVVLALLGTTVWALIRKPVVGFLGAWFFLILAPSSSVIPLVTQTMAEHRMYLPLAAVIALAVSGLHRLFRRIAGVGLSGSRDRLNTRPLLPQSLIPSLPFPLPLTLTLAFALPLGGLTAARNRDYREAVAIWTDNVAKYPDGARGQNNLAWALQQQGRTDQANAHYARAVVLEPGYVTAHYNWGVALLDQGRVADAIAQFESAVRLAPTHADAHVNLGNALMQVQRAAEAIPHYEAALRLKPAADANYDLGLALAEVGRTKDAADRFRDALQMNPGLAEAHYQLARLAAAAGQLADAERHYGETLRSAPDHVGAHRGLGLLLARSGQLAPAAKHFREVIRLRPDDADAHANLGNVLLLQGQAREAIAQYEEALRLRPDDGRLRESLRLAREALP